MKCWLRHLPLAAVRTAFARDHSFPEQEFGAAHRPLFREVVILHDENFTHVNGIIQKENVLPPNLVMDSVSIFLGEIFKKSNRVGRSKFAERVER